MSIRQIGFKGPLWALIVVIIIMELIFNTSAWANPDRHRQPTSYPQPGKVVKKIPSNHDTVMVGSKRYHFHDGVYYRKNAKGFSVVKAPKGARIKHLPSGVETLVMAGVTYFLFAGVYYQKGPSGYTVVEKPAQSASRISDTPATHRKYIYINTTTLNVRFGPGLNHAVVGKVRRGEVFPVQDNAPGWYYIKLKNGRFGWVMSKYTYAKLPNAKG